MPKVTDTLITLILSLHAAHCIETSHSAIKSIFEKNSLRSGWPSPPRFPSYPGQSLSLVGRVKLLPAPNADSEPPHTLPSFLFPVSPVPCLQPPPFTFTRDAWNRKEQTPPLVAVFPNSYIPEPPPQPSYRKPPGPQGSASHSEAPAAPPQPRTSAAGLSPVTVLPGSCCPVMRLWGLHFHTGEGREAGSHSRLGVAAESLLLYAGHRECSSGCGVQRLQESRNLKPFS